MGKSREDVRTEDASAPDDAALAGPPDQSILGTLLSLRTRWKDGAFVVGWELQSHVSGLALVGFARFGSLTAALPVMLLWSLLTTLAFHHARLAGRPDLLERTSWGTRSSLIHVRLMSVALSGFKAWLAGIQAFIYARVFGCVLRNGGCCWRQRLTRATVLGFGLTVFGVPTAHHLLSKAGYERAKLLRLGFLAAFLNVPFRVVASMLLVNVTLGLVDLPFV